MHYARFMAYGDVEGGKFHHDNKRREWHREKRSGGGYVIRYEPGNPNAGPNGYVYQHRHVMSEILGRQLRDGENVHHKNGDRADNRPENLELWVVAQPAGQRVEDLVAQAQEIIAEYGDLVDRMHHNHKGLRAV